METKFVKDEWDVRSVHSSEAKEWILYKHYAHRMPSITYAFGLYHIGGGQISPSLQGICTFGHPVALILIKNAFQGNYQDKFYELNRLCVNDGLPRNALSFFVGKCLQMLPRPMVIVSYADSGHHHHGYIYQATNWIYTGLSAPFKDYMVKGYEGMHNASILDMVGRSDGDAGHIDKVKLLKERFGEENVYMVERSRKHRYFYFLGSKTERHKMRSLLIYPQVPYPKGDNQRYDASYETSPVLSLF